MKKKKKPGLFLTVLPLYAFTLCFVVGPLLYMIALSFATPGAGSSTIWDFTLDNYKKIAEPVYLQSFAQSFQLAITSSLIRMYGWILILQAKGVLNTLLLKLGFIEEPLKILYSYPAVVIGMIYALLPFMILSVYSSVEKMDWSLVEAARDLGAGAVQAFFTITLKLTLPGLLTGVILTFIPSMGLFFIADILGGNKIVLVGSVIQDQLTRGSNWPFAAALAVVLMVLTSLMIVVYRKVTHVKDLEGLF